MKHFFTKFKETKAFRISKIIMDSASFALILSVAFFVYELSEGKKETQEVVDNLLEIQNSLSTRYLGLFPEYIYNINVFLEEAIEHQKTSKEQDSIIIFEDVLYYGIRSDAEGFHRMNKNLLQLANNGCHITIVHYDVNSRPFKQMVQDALIDEQYLTQYQYFIKQHFNNLKVFNQEREQLVFVPNSAEYEEAMFKLLKKHFPNICNELTRSTSINTRKYISHALGNYNFIDSLACELYFDSTKVTQQQHMQEKIEGYLMPIPIDKEAKDGITLQVNNMCSQLDKIMNTYLNKTYRHITYADFYHMYIDMTKTIVNLLSTQPNIELIQLNETLMMSCWLTKVGDQERAIFAFPSKYSTDEIGFISQDKAFSKYIHTMLNGIKNSNISSTLH